MKTIVYIFGIVALIATACGSKKDATSSSTTSTTASKDIIKIVHGTTFGFCHGYCNKTVTYTSNSVVYEQYGRDSVAFPPGSLKETFSKEAFDALVNKFKWNEWDTLPANIGCPDCTDRGAEFIMVVTSKGTKKVRFDAGETSPQSFTDVLPTMRANKKNFDHKLNNPED